MTDLKPFIGFPFQIHGTTKYDKSTLAIKHGDLVLEDNGQYEMTQGIHALAQRLESTVHEVSDPRSTLLEDVPLNIAQALVQGPEHDYLDSIFAVRSDGFTVEIEFSAVGYSDVYVQRLRLAEVGGQFPLQVVSRETLVTISKFEDALLAHIQRNPDLLRSISPRRFEEVVARVFEKMGFEVTLTRFSKDEGVDIFAVRHEGAVPVLLVIDCKQYAPKRPIGPEMVRMLYGLRAQHHANTAMIATTSYITKGSAKLRMKFGEDKIELADFDRINGWLGDVGWEPGPGGILVPSGGVTEPPKLWVPGGK